MAYIPSECTLEEYESVVYSSDAKNRLYVKHGSTVIGTDGDNNASPFASKLTIKRRLLKNGSKTITLNNFISQEVDLVLHDYKIENLYEEVEIKIGTFIDSVNDYVYVPIGKFLIQDNPTTDKNKITYKLRDFSVKFDTGYNAKPLMDENGGTATKLQILNDICNKAGVTCKVTEFIGSDDVIGIYDNTINGRVYISYIAEQAGCIAYMNRSGELEFIPLNSILNSERPIPEEIIESFVSGDSFKVSKIIYESGVFKYEEGTDENDTLYISQANPYIANEEQLQRIFPNVNLFEINSFKTGKVLGNPALDPYDLIKVEFEGQTYKTLAQYTLTYTGTMTSKYETTIEHDAKQSNVNASGTATIKKYVKSEIDNVNATIKNEVGRIEEDTTQKITTTTQTVDGLLIEVSKQQTQINETSGEVEKLANTLNDMSYNFGTDALDINKTDSPNSAKINNEGMKLYNYDNLKLISNQNGTGIQKLIVVGDAQIGYLRFVKEKDEKNQECTDIHHLVSNIQTLEDLEVEINGNVQ